MDEVIAHRTYKLYFARQSRIIAWKRLIRGDYILEQFLRPKLRFAANIYDFDDKSSTLIGTLLVYINIYIYICIYIIYSRSWG